MIGTIQPAVLFELVGKGTDDNGLMSRFLFADLNYNFTPLSSDGGGIDLTEMLADIYRRVNALPPTTYKLNTAAFQVFAAVFDDYGRKALDQSKGSWERNAWAKAGGQLARLCLNLHLVWGCMDGSVDEWIQPSTVERATQLMNYFISQTISIIANQSPSLPPQLVKTLAVAKVKGGVTPRELYHAVWGKLKPQNVSQAREWLNELVELGYGEFIPVGKTLQFRPSVDGFIHTYYPYPIRVLAQVWMFLHFLGTFSQKMLWYVHRCQLLSSSSSAALCLLKQGWGLCGCNCG